MFSAALNAAENGVFMGYGKNEPRSAAQAALRICVICVICGSKTTYAGNIAFA
jgi:hypothetical protein